ncbi:S41 family peptidase [Pseudooctadecabacter jejudonensis]|uniref:Tail-specific protease n=1 Tax=Pseudooctadecabacter jejudonensis TaxID=1391910 RepID=A0A1Y5R9E4_9RHOB|nr:S41 family peptidase [Pseudooctadecabacter jejudonensis]SLN11836.1 Tail-specific protease precursor [Pseudooctadecabacter jejudonensis]
MRLMRQLWITLAVLMIAFVASWVWYMPDSTQRGVWRSPENAALLRLTPFTATLYSETSQSCVEQLTFPAHLKLVEWAEGAVLTAQGDTLTLAADGMLDTWAFTRIDALPEGCGPAQPDTATPREVFDTLWHAMNDHYAFFDLYGVDWDARRTLAPPPVATMGDAALQELLMTTLAGLEDGHVGLATPRGYSSPKTREGWLTASPTFTRSALTDIARQTIGTDLTRVDQTAIEYTLLSNGIGYAIIPYMDINTPFATTSGPAMALAFEEVADAFADARAIILDLRYNPGGSDTVAFGIASHFTATALPVFTKSTRSGAGQTAPFTAALAPFDNTPLDQPVLILTSELTGSAAEIFTMTMQDLPQVTTMGTPTSGALSDVLEVVLPNGWSLGLSHQTYRQLDGTSPEGVGLLPDIAVPVDTDSLMAGQDMTLRRAFDHLR